VPVRAVFTQRGIAMSSGLASGGCEVNKCFLAHSTSSRLRFLRS
jgi:hypothetical protein